MAPQEAQTAGMRRSGSETDFSEGEGGPREYRVRKSSLIGYVKMILGDVLLNITYPMLTDGSRFGLLTRVYRLCVTGLFLEWNSLPHGCHLFFLLDMERISLVFVRVFLNYCSKFWAA